MSDPTPEQVEALARRVSLAFEGWGQAWWTDDSGDILARIAAEAVLAAGYLSPDQVAAKQREAWDQGYLRGTIDTTSDLEPADNPYAAATYPTEEKS